MWTIVINGQFMVLGEIDSKSFVKLRYLLSRIEHGFQSSSFANEAFSKFHIIPKYASGNVYATIRITEDVSVQLRNY